MQFPPAALEFNLSLFLRYIETEARLVHGITGQASHVFCRRERHRPDVLINPVRINETRFFHFQLLGQGIHMRDKCVNRREFFTGRWNERFQL